MMQDYDITVAVGASRQLDAQGEYFYYNAGSAGGADPTIKLRGLSSGLTIKLKPGQGFRLPAGEKETSWVITNFAGAATIIGFVTVGDGDITDNRITGSVEVIDGGKNRTISKAAFLARVYCSPIASNYSQIQIWNPLGSNKNIIIEKFMPSTSTTMSIVFGGSNTQLTTLNGQPSSKLFGSGALSVAQNRVQNIPNLLTSLDAETYITAFQPYVYDFREPIILQPNNGFNCIATTMNAGLLVNFEFFEEQI